MLVEIFLWIYLVMVPSLYYYSFFLSDVVFDPDNPREWKITEVEPYFWYKTVFQCLLWFYFLYVLTTEYIS